VRLLGLPDALREFDLEPVLSAGWETRGLEFDDDPIITLRHWTAGAITGKSPSLRIVTFGRPDLKGPLATVLQERTGGSGLDRVHVIASGRANHAGEGSWQGVTSGNRRGTGNEIEWAGPHEAFPVNRIETSERIAAALLSLSKYQDGKHACEHREYALPPGRKIDTNLNGDTFRLRVHELLHPPEDDDMTPEQEKLLKRAAAQPQPMLLRLSTKDPAVLYMSTARQVQWVQTGEALQGYKIDMQMNGMSPDVCTLHAGDLADSSLDELYDFVVNLPFLGPWPHLADGTLTPTKAAWKGPHYPGE
jgi:hypothetical protein